MRTHTRTKVRVGLGGGRDDGQAGVARSAGPIAIRRIELLLIPLIRSTSFSLDALGIPPWRRTLGDEPAKTLAILSHEPVKHVDERRQSERAKDASEGSGELDLGKEHEGPTSVARDWGTIAEYEPPAFAAPFLRHRSEQAPGLLIGERKQCQFFASVERGDDPRRPTAEPSAAGIEQDRARQVRGGRYARAHVLRPVRRKTMPRTCYDSSTTNRSDATSCTILHVRGHLHGLVSRPRLLTSANEPRAAAT
jgi:hypothetical protein